MDYPRRELLDHVAWKENICIGLGRQGLAVNDPLWSLIAIARIPIDSNIFRRGGINVFPLYLYPEDQSGKEKQRTFQITEDWKPGKEGRIPNLDKAFIEELSDRINMAFVSDGRGDLKKTFGPEDVLDYIYGVFHSPRYRQKYAEFLKIDFPRVPWPEDKSRFIDVSEVGGRLVKLHLMESEVLEDEKLQPKFPIEGDMAVAKGYPKYELGKIFINPKQYFVEVSEEVWRFRIGGYQVCEKWLKDRRERKLNYEDIQHYKKVCVALAETIRSMQDDRLNIF